MTSRELELHLEHLEALLDEITALVDDPEIPDDELRDHIRTVLQEDVDDDE